MVLPGSAAAVQFDTVISASGQLNVIPSVQRVRMGAQHAGKRAHVWADELSIHISIDQQVIKTVPSNLHADDLHNLRMRGAHPAGPPPAQATPAGLDQLPAGTAIELDRVLDVEGCALLASKHIKIGAELGGQKVTLRLDGHLMRACHKLRVSRW